MSRTLHKQIIRSNKGNSQNWHEYEAQLSIGLEISAGHIKSPNEQTDVEKHDGRFELVR